MTSRRTRFHRSPPIHAKPANLFLDVDLIDLAHSAASETLQSGGPASAMLGQLEGLLAAGSYLTWKGDGPGLGRELRRSYSNIHGRYLGRYYLEVHENVHGLIPIEGSNFQVSASVVVRLKDGENGDMPDWIGWNASGFVIAEAKGTYAKGDWAKSFRGWHAMPQCLQKAQEQIGRVQIDDYGAARNVKFKGWSVASRWSTESNGLDPWLAAIDPEQGAADIPRSRFERAVAAMQRLVARRMLRSLGLGEGDQTSVGRGSESGFDVPPNVPEQFVKTLLLRGEEPLRGISAAVGQFGFLTVSTEEDLAYLRGLPPDLRPTWIVTLQEKPLRLAQEGVFFPEYEYRRRPEVVVRNGVAVSKLDAITELA